MTISDRIAELARRLRLSLRMDRTGEPFFLEADEIASDLETIAAEIGPVSSQAGERLHVKQSGYGGEA